MKLNCVKTCKNETKLNEDVKENVYYSFIGIFKVYYIVFWQEGASLFKVAYLIEVSSKFMEGKSNNLHIFALPCSSSSR